MLPESLLVHEAALIKWCPGFDSIKKRIIANFGKQIQLSAAKNKKIQDSFGFEWNLLRKDDKLKIWDLDAAEFKTQLLKELQIPATYTPRLALDAGCGHGRSARLIADFSKTVIGAEVSPAVELAYEQNDKKNCHFIQADVHYLPFSNQQFQLVYSSGVLHHNPSTKVAFEAIAKLAAPGAIACIWLYHPFKNALHRAVRLYRSITVRLPVEVVYYLNSLTITPLQWLFSQVKGKKKKWTEIAIEELDMLTPAYRHEHTADEVSTWMSAAFKNITVTDEDAYGFSIKGEKMDSLTGV